MTFYSHYCQNASGERKQTVTEHCRNTAAYARHALESVAMGEAGYLAGLVHDLGKMKREFQEYLLYGTGSRGSVNHTFAGCRLLLREFRQEHPDPCENLTAELLAYSVGAHHGLFDCIAEDGQSGFRHRLEKESIGYDESRENFLAHCADRDELTKRFHAANAALTPVYERIGNLAGDSNEEVMFYLGLLERLLLSSVIEGDRRDTAEFMTGMYRPPEPENISEFWTPYLFCLEEKLSRFQQDTPIQLARAEISQKCREFGEEKGGIIRLNVPTGAGKTVSSLRFALSHARKWGKRRLIFTSPLLTILEQNAAILRDFLGDDSIVLEHHSNVVESEDSAEWNELELAVDSWYSPVIITTLVQFLNTLFAGKTTSIRRFQSLCNSVIVIDEVQTVPLRMLSLFNLAINFLAEICNATVVLCSATQPCLESVIHPIRPVPSSMVPYDKQLWKPFQRTQIMDAGAKTMDETIDFIRESMEQVNSLLVVCNKKDQAETLSEMLDGSADVCCHLSAAMCPAHRRQTLKQLYQALETGKSCLCVATQVIEAGVDISFQCVIRLAAGMDSVIQAAGRCNRNADLSHSPVYIVTLLDENLGFLQEIQRGKNATLSLLDAYRRNPDRFQGDLASDTAISFYYNRLYSSMPQDGQDFPLSDREGITLFSLLSDNATYFGKNDSRDDGYILNQAFCTAGNAFSVFDCDTQDVIVPFGEGKNLIAELLARKPGDAAFLSRWISRAKSYMVSLYSYQLRELVDVIAEHDGVKILPPEYYNERTGFTIHPEKHDFLEV